MAEMNKETMKEFLFSLAWMSHSAYHSRNVLEILKKAFPDSDFSQDVEDFKKIVNSEESQS
jgi:hypothetical protein